MPRTASDDPAGIEVTVAPHARRQGWETIKISYSWRDRRHAKQVETILGAVARARREAVEEQDEGSGGEGP